MQVSAALCILVAVACMYSAKAEMQKTVEDLQNFLDKATDEFEELADSNGQEALQHAISTIIKGLMTSGELVNAGLISAAEAAENMSKSFFRGVAHTLHVEEIRDFAESVCTSRKFPFSQPSLNTYPGITREMNENLECICKALEALVGQ